MTGGNAFDVRKGDRTYRAPSLEVLLRWAGERRISADDGLRPAGGESWGRAGDMPELAAILDPANWWTVRMGDRSYTAPDFDTVVRWTREGRLTTDAVIEGPRTPPGGVLAQGLPRLGPFLRPADTGGAPRPRLRIDGIEYHPADMDAVRRWITESRVPVDAMISLSGGPWEPVSECGALEPGLWPAGAWGETVEDEPAETPSGPSAEIAQTEEAPPPRVAQDLPEPQEESPAPAGADSYRIRTVRGEISVRSPKEMRRLLRTGRIRSFDRVDHPSLPGGASVGSVLGSGGAGRRRPGLAWIVWLIAAAAAATAFVLVDPLDLDLLSRLGTAP